MVCRANWTEEQRERERQQERARRVARRTEVNLERVLICPDVHVPYHHDLAWRTFLATARGWKPHRLVILGDFGDFYKVSDYPKDPARKLDFVDEVAAVNAELDRVSALHIEDVIFCEGNHETRLTRYINSQASALAGLPGMQPVQLLHVRERGWGWVPYGSSAAIGKINFVHDTGRSGVNAARQAVEDMGGNVVQGHTHRAGCHYTTSSMGERHVGWTMGWLGDPECIDYRHRARVMRENQHGFGVARIEKSTGLGWVHFVPILGGRACVDGVMYDGRSVA